MPKVKPARFVNGLELETPDESTVCMRCLRTAHQDCPDLTEEEKNDSFVVYETCQCVARKARDLSVSPATDEKKEQRKELLQLTVSHEEFSSFKTSVLDVISQKDAEILRLREEISLIKSLKRDKDTDVPSIEAENHSASLESDLSKLKTLGMRNKTLSSYGFSESKAVDTLATLLNHQCRGKPPNLNVEEGESFLVDYVFNGSKRQWKSTMAENVNLREFMKNSQNFTGLFRDWDKRFGYGNEKRTWAPGKVSEHDLIGRSFRDWDKRFEVMWTSFPDTLVYVLRFHDAARGERRDVSSKITTTKGLSAECVKSNEIQTDSFSKEKFEMKIGNQHAKNGFIRMRSHVQERSTRFKKLHQLVVTSSPTTNEERRSLAVMRLIVYGS